jgi:hypothetical protein
MEQQFEVARISPAPLAWRMPDATIVDRESPTRRHEVLVDEIEFRCLETARDIAEVQRLRAEIRLPSSAAAAAGFATQEKKEIRKASWGLSTGATRPSARCASFPCAPA